MNRIRGFQILSVLLVITLLLPGAMPAQPISASPMEPQASFDCSTVTEIPQTECEALVALYNSTGGDGWTNHTDWLATTTPCSWYGVTCTDNHVTRLNLSNNQVNGVIPPQIGNLTSLQYLYLYINQLSGVVPPEIGNLTALRQLLLDHNQLSGAIPPEIGNLTALQYLSLEHNQLGGAIPPEIGNLTALQQLTLFNNQLSGAIPREIGNLTAMQRLYLSNNQLSGVIPHEIRNLTALTILSLGSNQLSGAIPPEIGNLTSLQYLYLYINQLSGVVPPEIGNLTALRQLSLDHNQLSGAIPPEIGNLTALRQLALHNNQLSGVIPREIGNLTTLDNLQLQWNQLSGTVPQEIGNLTALTFMDLTVNQLTGAIPPEIGNLTALTILSLGSNQLSGAIPPEIGNLTALQNLTLYNNRLSGAIPPEIGDLIALETLQLQWNQLSGTVPQEIGNLTALTFMNLATNQLTGTIPSVIGNLTALTFLGLFNNQLSGTIPSEIGNLTALTGLRLEYNQLSGPIPSEIGALVLMEELHLYNNQLNGLLPNEMGNLAALTKLYLHNNPLHGELPAALAALPLDTFFFYNTDLCIPSTGDMPTWLSGIAELYSSGLVCDQDPGSLGGIVTLTDATAVPNILVTLYRPVKSTPWSASEWRQLSTTRTTAAGTYEFTDLGQGLGIDYRVRFVDPTHELAPQYYDAKPTIATATVITITPGIPRTGIDAVLALPQPPAAGVETESGSVVFNPDGTAQITMPQPNLSDITITRTVTCAVGTPTTVTLLLSTGPQFPMANVGGDAYQATILAAALTANATLRVRATCGVTTTETVIGYVTLYDPSGIVSDVRNSQPIAGATVTLYQVPGWEPKTGPTDNRPNTCESNLSKPAGTPWSQPAPTELGIVVNPEVTMTAPQIPYQQTTVEGYYGWDVPQGCWYVTVTAEGYEPFTSPVVGIPPAVVDLDLALTPLGGVDFKVFLPLVLRQQ